MTKHATAWGTAGEHIVCADLILSGFTAYLTSQGLPYDIVVDLGGKLLRVAVKSTGKAKPRPAREGSVIRYQFVVCRSRRLSTGKTDARFYEASDVDIIAFCALDIRQVAYCHISECAQSMHFVAPGAPEPINNRGLMSGMARKTFETYTLARAIGVHDGVITPFPFKWRSRRVPGITKTA
jgi:hypothetical protein